MAKYTCNIELDASLMTSTVAGKPLAVDLAKMPNVALVEFLRYGVQRKFNDGVGGKDTPAEDKIAKALERIAAFERGEIRAARGAGVSELLRVSRRVAEAAFIAAKGKDHPEVKALDDMDEDIWSDTMDMILAKNQTKLQPAIDAQMEELARARAAKAAVKAMNVGLELDL